MLHKEQINWDLVLNESEIMSDRVYLYQREVRPITLQRIV